MKLLLLTSILLCLYCQSFAQTTPQLNSIDDFSDFSCGTCTNGNIPPTFTFNTSNPFYNKFGKYIPTCFQQQNIDSITYQFKYVSSGTANQFKIETEIAMQIKTLLTKNIVGIDSGIVKSKVVGYFGGGTPFVFNIQMSGNNATNFSITYKDLKVIQYSCASTVGIYEYNALHKKVWVYNGIIYFDNNLFGKTINIYNMVGQNIYSNTVNSESLKLELEAGIYTIELDNAYKKIMIN